MILVCHYAKTMFSINLTAIGNADEVTAANEENTADAIKTHVPAPRLARQQVLCLASGVSLRRSDEGYEKANYRRGCAQGLRHCPGDGSVLHTQETGARFEAGWDGSPRSLWAPPFR
jgi:hypothetical protein